MSLAANPKEHEGVPIKEKGAQPPFKEQAEFEPPGVTSEMSPKPDHGEQTYKGFGRLKDKVALITGGDSGIGRAIAIAYAREGCDVLISYLPEEEEDAKETAQWVERAGRRCVQLPGDIQDEQHCTRMVETAMKEFNRLDILINNAAYQMGRHESLESFSTEEIERTFRTNIFAQFWLARAAVPHMTHGCSIINTTSIQAYKPNPALLAYAATKGAIANFTKGLAKLVAKQGVRVNAVAPGPVWTPLIPASFGKGKIEEFGKDESLFERPAQPAEIAPVYVFLASEDARDVTGEIYGITGGSMPY